MEKHIGNCSCGDIEFYFNNDPINSIFCYCTECQSLTGSDKWFGLWVPRDNFKFTKGTPLSYMRVGDSGKKVNYHFCGTCSTVLCAEVTAGNFYSVSATSLKDNKFTPKMSIYASSAPSWAIFPSDVPKFDALPPGMGG
ncbi:GFA family protein [Vibrio mangrovi]|uniref:GFA family protein n=1 Tax=Vibrio mangrovi TaxID=474394 RepID=A0A1Y6IXH1_9VIBR|nr:GFA family protein [Vibrio mangrovi]MDW6002846.1 GFA family protein [Vibrio mangrovi]SMS02336.1 Glutathione-dependent formaldehyde-activating enzyme [Vibrio mangrovi]